MALTRTFSGRPIGFSISGRNMPELPISIYCNHEMGGRARMMPKRTDDKRTKKDVSKVKIVKSTAKEERITRRLALPSPSPRAS